MPYIIEVVKAGNTIEVSKYYSSRFNKKGVKRGKRKQLTTDEQREVNKRAAEKKLPLIMWAVRKNDEEEGYYEPMETPELFGKASLTAWIISTVWFLVLPLYVLMLAEKITGKDKDNEQY